MIPLTNYDSSEGEQWGRYNLPRYIHVSMFCLMISPSSWFDNSCMACCHAEAAAQAPRLVNVIVDGEHDD